LNQYEVVIKMYEIDFILISPSVNWAKSLIIRKHILILLII
jgi:hypothetical protein